MTRKDKHRLLAKLAGVPWQFQCPECGGTYFGSSHDATGYKLTRHCHDQLRGMCNWEGTDEECRLTPDYDKDHNAWIVIRLALDGKCLWAKFVNEHASHAPITMKDDNLPWWTWWLLNDLPGQVDAAIEVMRGD